MALNRPPKSMQENGPFNDPEDRTYDLGLMQVTLHKMGDLRNESAVNLKIESDRDSLLEPIYENHSRQPSAADMLITLLKEGISASGMMVLENRDGPPGQPQTPPAAENRIKLSLREFSSYKPGGSGITIRAEKGVYDGHFNADALMENLGATLEKCAERFRDARSVEAFETLMTESYTGVDMYNESLDEALRPKKQLQRIEQSAESKMELAVRKFIPDAGVTPEQKTGVIDKIVKGVLCAGEACWTNGNLAGKVDETLQDAYGDKMSDHVRGYLVDELCKSIGDVQRGLTK